MLEECGFISASAPHFLGSYSVPGPGLALGTQTGERCGPCLHPTTSPCLPGETNSGRG